MRVLADVECGALGNLDRRTLGGVANGASELHRQFAGRLIADANREANGTRRPAVFHVDNHTREYTGHHTLAWHWKMQAKRAVQGVTDYWIHDSHGRPVSPITAIQQGSLVEFLPKCADVVRGGLGDQPPVLLVFDRGGAFPVAMVELREFPEGSVDFLTYERAPFRRHGREWFERHGLTIELRDGSSEIQRVLLADRGANLGKGRGRVRRIMLLMPDNTQVSLLTSSQEDEQEDASWLAETLFSRWLQENAFKYGAERWGFNQLDSRQVEPYAPGTTISNPYRRNLERSRDDALAREGKLRCKLAGLRPDDPKRAEYERALAETTHLLKLVRASLKRSPKRISIEETHLAGKLVHHKRDYKLLVDTIRVACAQAEDRLALLLQSHMSNPDEAKRLLQNLLKAAGNVRVSGAEIVVTLDPCGYRAERRALRELFQELDHLPLSRPGDPLHRHLRFVLKGAA